RLERGEATADVYAHLDGDPEAREGPHVRAQGDRNSGPVKAEEVLPESRKALAKIPNIGIAARVPLRVGRRTVAREDGRRQSPSRSWIGEDTLDEGLRVRQELEDVHRWDVEDGPGLHHSQGSFVDALENAVRERGRAAGDHFLRV